MDTLVAEYRGCEIRIGPDGWHYVCRKHADGTIEYLTYGGCGGYKWTQNWGGRSTFYGPSTPRDNIDKVLGQPQG